MILDSDRYYTEIILKKINALLHSKYYHEYFKIHLYSNKIIGLAIVLFVIYTIIIMRIIFCFYITNKTIAKPIILFVI